MLKARLNADTACRSAALDCMPHAVKYTLIFLHYVNISFVVSIVPTSTRRYYINELNVAFVAPLPRTTVRVLISRYVVPITFSQGAKSDRHFTHISWRLFYIAYECTMYCIYVYRTVCEYNGTSHLLSVYVCQIHDDESSHNWDDYYPSPSSWSLHTFDCRYNRWKHDNESFKMVACWWCTVRDRMWMGEGAKGNALKLFAFYTTCTPGTWVF